jgi:Zn-dependent protease
MNGEEGPEPQAPPEPRSPFEFDVDRIQGLVQSYFKVYEVEREIRGIPKGQIAAFYVQMDAGSFTEKFEALRAEIRRLDANLLVILQHRLGEDVILVARKPPVVEKGPTVNIVLLILTVITTTLGGSLFYQPYAGAENLITYRDTDLSFLHYRLLFWGFLTFSLPLILILGVHELGHYFVARRHHVKTSLPYFIPVPPVVPIGTFGAFISMREPIPDRKALFDIGASGPLLGFLVAIPVVLLGMVLTSVYAVPVPPEPEVHEALAGPGLELGRNATVGSNSTWAFGFAVYANRTEDGGRLYVETIDVRGTNGTLPAGDWTLRVDGLHVKKEQSFDLELRLRGNLTSDPGGDFTADGEAKVARLQRKAPLNTTTFEYAFTVPDNATRLTADLRWHRPATGYVRLGDSLLFLGLQKAVGLFLPVPDDVFTHPTGIAGWVGLLVTGFNLLPAGQLDGGHVARAVLGERMRWASYASVALMFLLSFEFRGWIVMAILLVFLGLQHPPPLNDKSTLDRRRMVIAFLILVLLVVTFVPYPFIDV